MIYIYVLSAVVAVIIIIYIYIRLSYGFWYYQPVFHLYDLKYYLFPCGIIQHENPEKNRYTNLINVYTSTSMNERKTKHFVFFIRKHFLKNQNNVFLPKKINIEPYFAGHNHPCFYSFYVEDQHFYIQPDVITNKTTIDTNTIKNKNNDEQKLSRHSDTDIGIIKEKKIIGVMTTRPLHVSIYKNKAHKKEDAVFYVYYVDYLCVDKYERKKGIAPQIIQTHHYRQRRGNPNIQVSLFKREGTLTGIVPLCVYSTFAFSCENWIHPDSLHPPFSLIECGGQNLNYLLDFMKINMSELFDICITPELYNVLELLKTNNIFIYYLLETQQDGSSEIMSAYFFRRTCVSLDKGKECISCFASISTAKLRSSIFHTGFLNSLYLVKKKVNCQILCIENISHNHVLIREIQKHYKEMIVSPTAYFFYNFAYPTFNSNKCFLLC